MVNLPTLILPPSLETIAPSNSIADEAVPLAVNNLQKIPHTLALNSGISKIFGNKLISFIE